MPKSGEEHPNSVLTAEIVKEIRENALQVGGLNDYQMARKIGCDRATVRLVRLNATWHDPDYTPPPPRRAGRPKKSESKESSA